MKKYLQICVTYHSDEALHNFVESVSRAAERVNGRMQVDVEVADNGQDNKGYLGGALELYNQKAMEYDYVSISNVDLLLEPDFFEQLLKIDTTNIGWIAPDIYTAQLQRHENPYMLSRPNKRNFVIWNTIYSCTSLYRLYYLLYKLKSKQKKTYSRCDIYAGHGSFMLFTKAFVRTNPEIHFPGFMYGEEIYMAELIRVTQLKAIYDPSLRIANIGHISTGLFNQKQKSEWSKASLCAIHKQFFE